MSVELFNLSKVYGSQKAIDEISFQVNKGEIVGFLGPNGAGKSTTMKIISGYLIPTSGTAKVNGLDILENSLKVKKLIGYLPENNPLYEDLYIKEYLLFIARVYGLVKPKKRIDEVVSQTGLTPEINKKIGALSKGYRQRVGLAQALLHNPEVLLLDEPTSGLDPNQIVEIRNLIMEIGKEKTIILSSHIMQEVQAMCNRVIIINKGKIVANDQTDRLLSKTRSKINVQVVFKNEVKKEDLSKIKFVTGVSKIANGYLLSSDNKGIQEAIFNYAVEKSNPILEMYAEQEKLEKVFQELTTKSS